MASVRLEEGGEVTCFALPSMQSVQSLVLMAEYKYNVIADDAR